MEQHAILALGALILLSCGTGLLFVHTSSPLLKGLNWMGAALVAGGAASLLMLLGISFPRFEPVAYVAGLLAFMCSFRADQYLLCEEARRSALGYTLLAVQCAMVPVQWLHLCSPRLPVVVASVVFAVQIETAARLLDRNMGSGPRLPVRFSAGLMRFLVALSVIRCIAVATGSLDDPRRAHLAATVTYTLFIAVAVALGFAFFWRTTTRLTGELEQMASTDPLTRVFNRRVFLAWCEKEILRSRESGLPLSVIFVDFDHFKRINDTFGHHVGDQVLCAAVERMQDSVRGIDVLCRWGGEEFAVLLPNAGPEATLLVAERMRQNIKTVNSDLEPFSDLPDELQLTASIGAASFAEALDTVHSLLDRADAAMYEAKDAGRDRVILAARPSWDPVPAEAAARANLPERRLASAT